MWDGEALLDKGKLTKATPVSFSEWLLIDSDASVHLIQASVISAL